MKLFRSCLPALGILLCMTTRAAEEPVDPRDVATREVQETPAFLVRVDVDRPDHLYRGGDEIKVRVQSERAGYLYLFYCDASRHVSCLFPNQVQSDNRIPAQQPVIVPAAESRFRLRVGAPFGNEVLKALVTSQPLKALEISSLTKSSSTPLSTSGLKAVFVEAKTDQPAPTPSSEPRLWSEHYVQLTTLAAAGAVPQPPRLDSLPGLNQLTTQPGPTQPPRPPGPKRVGVFIGVSNYQDEGIRPLKVAHRDAATFAKAMEANGGLDEGVLLTNEQATLANIRRVILEALPAITRPGDLIILYWSGHGGRCSNVDGTEPDGFDEYLVPYDGQLEPADAIRRTMLLDKTFGRWVQALDGRKLVVIIDACHSGGQTQGATKSLTANSDAPFRKFFAATTMNRTKDIGQRETAILASSRASQVSFERRDGDLSVMTHYLIESLERNDGSVTLDAAAEYVKSAVPAYVEKHFPGTTQTPVFINQTTPPVYLRP